jgi:L-seryl-tRNA(Ser) seleniumtransferase
VLAGLTGAEVALVPCQSQAGSGSMPARDLPSWGVRLRVEGRDSVNLAAGLRTGQPAILARLQEGALLFDVRTLDDPEVPWIGERLRELVGQG